MKKTLTHLTAVCAFLVLGSIAYAQQCTGSVYIKNGSQDSWTIDYYGVVSPAIPAGTDFTLGFTNANGVQGRGLYLSPTISPTITPFCGHKFQTNPDIWNAPCASGTIQVSYSGTQDPATGCYTSALIYIQ